MRGVRGGVGGRRILRDGGGGDGGVRGRNRDVEGATSKATGAVKRKTAAMTTAAWARGRHI